MGAVKELLFAQSDPSIHGPRAIPRIDESRDLTWAEINDATRGAVGKFSLPCPFCGPEMAHSSRFRIERPTLGYARWYCFYCGESGSLRRNSPTDPKNEAAARRAAVAREQEQKAERTARALALWEAASTIVGSLVVDYLQARAIRDLPPDVDAVLRYHPSCSFGRDGPRPCMLALMRDVRTDKPRAVHRTWIGSGGRALGRMALGPIARAAVKLWPTGGPSLVVGEGIETVLAAALHLERADGEALRPAWALTVANNLTRFPLIRGVQRLVILTDNDVSGVGQRAAETCSSRWCDAGRQTVKLIPNRLGADFNDVLKEAAL